MRDTIEMAREAGKLKCDCCLPYYEETDIEGFEGFLEHFATLVRADERELIAQSMDKQADLAADDIDRQWAQEMAAAIRARGNT
jgi:hypothetical protein